MTAPTDTPSTRERLIAAMLDALRTRGLHGVGLNALLATAGAPKGVLYHHFPGGKMALAVAAVERVVGQGTATLDALSAAGASPLELLRHWISDAGQVLAASGFASGSALASAALESSPQDQALRAAVAAGYDAIRQRLAAPLAAAGLPAERAGSVAALAVATCEGALLQARVAGQAALLTDCTNALLELLAPCLASPAPPPPAPPRHFAL